MPTHSETPWTVYASTNEGIITQLILSPDAERNYLVAETVSNEPRDLANAAHICLCVNAHEELKAKLLEVVSIFQGRVHSTAAMNVLHEASELIARLNGVSQ